MTSKRGGAAADRRGENRQRECKWEGGTLEVRGLHSKTGRDVWDVVVGCGRRLSEEGAAWPLSTACIRVARVGEMVGTAEGE
jgi:hypothetical protein